MQIESDIEGCMVRMCRWAPNLKGLREQEKEVETEGVIHVRVSV